MIYGEKPESRELHQDGKGLVGTTVFRCDWVDVDPAPIEGLPKYGDPWLDPAGNPNPFLRVVDVRAEEGPAGTCLYIVQFSTERQLKEEFCDISLDIGVEPGPELLGWKWTSTQTWIGETIGYPIPVGILSVRMRKELPLYITVMETVNKVNDRVFLGYPAGCLLFVGATAENNYDLAGNVTSTATTFKFSAKQMPHKYFWRPPLQALSAPPDYTPLIWQNFDSGKDFYTTDPTKIGMPVWINEKPGQESNPAGIAGWDTRERDGLPYIEERDFATVLGIPVIEGDDPAG